MFVDLEAILGAYNIHKLLGDRSSAQELTALPNWRFVATNRARPLANDTALYKILLENTCMQTREHDVSRDFTLAFSGHRHHA